MRTKALPSRMALVGIVTTAPDAAVRTSPPAAEAAIAVIGSGRMRGAAEEVRIRAERVR